MIKMRFGGRKDRKDGYVMNIAFDGEWIMFWGTESSMTALSDELSDCVGIGEIIYFRHPKFGIVLKVSAKAMQEMYESVCSD